MLADDGMTYIMGDPTEDAILEQAGIHRAKALLCAVDSDAVNVYITLTARSLNPDLFILSRAARQESVEKLRRAGSNRVISPYTLSGVRMASLSMQPAMIEFVDMISVAPDLRIEELVIPTGSPFARPGGPGRLPALRGGHAPGPQASRRRAAGAAPGRQHARGGRRGHRRGSGQGAEPAGRRERSGRMMPDAFVTADATAIRAEAWLLRLQGLQLVLLVVAAVVGAIGLVADDERLVGLVIVGCLIAVWLCRLIQRLAALEHDWYNGRAAAESVKTLVWRYAMRVPPFHDARTAAARLDERVTEVTVSVELPAGGPAVTPDLEELRNADLGVRAERYLTERIDRADPGGTRPRASGSVGWPTRTTPRSSSSPSPPSAPPCWWRSGGPTLP